ncbi:MAG: DinB family protein [Bacteroidota bacterium]
MTNQLDRLDRLRASLLAEVQAVPPSARTWRPAPGTWSALEIVEHLVLAEEEVLGDLQDPASQPAQTRTARHWVGFALVLGVLASPIRVRIPSPGMQPTGAWMLGPLETRWDTHHRRLRTFVEHARPHDLRRPIFAHPVAGPLSPRQALWMLEVHLRLHHRQLRRRLRVYRAALPTLS